MEWFFAAVSMPQLCVFLISFPTLIRILFVSACPLSLPLLQTKESFGVKNGRDSVPVLVTQEVTSADVTVLDLLVD